MKTKKFDKNLYNQYDEKAKELVKRFYKETWQQELTDNPDKYGIDLFCVIDGKVLGVEVEVKNNWDGIEFPFKTIQVPTRKMKYFKAGNPVEYVLLNKQMDMCLILLGEDILNCKVKEVKNKYVPEGEMFFDVPETYAGFFSLKLEKESI